MIVVTKHAQLWQPSWIRRHRTWRPVITFWEFYWTSFSNRQTWLKCTCSTCGQVAARGSANTWDTGESLSDGNLSVQVSNEQKFQHQSNRNKLTFSRHLSFSFDQQSQVSWQDAGKWMGFWNLRFWLQLVPVSEQNLAGWASADTDCLVSDRTCPVLPLCSLFSSSSGFSFQQLVSVSGPVRGVTSLDPPEVLRSGSRGQVTTIKPPASGGAQGET